MTNEKAHTILGVAGRLMPAHRWPTGETLLRHSGLFSTQTWIAVREYQGARHRERMTITLGFDDDCKNGHHTFSAVCDIREHSHGAWRDSGGGAAHEQMAKVFPELAPLFQWHLVSTDGPLHYLANTVYLAGDRDHYGRAKGEPSAFDHFVYFGDSPVGHKISGKLATFLQSRMDARGDAFHARTDGASFQVIAFAHPRDPKTYSPHYTLAGFGDQWHECPFRTEVEANEFALAVNTCRCFFIKQPTAFSDGKARELDGARRAANWPEATDAELCADRAELRDALEARLPALLAEFRRAMVETCGFSWE